MHNNSGTLHWRSGVTLLRNISKPTVEVHQDLSVPRDGPRAYLRRLHVIVLCLMVRSANSASDQGSYPQASEAHQLLSLRDFAYQWSSYFWSLAVQHFWSSGKAIDK